MLSKNNYKERLRKMESRQDRFSIRKLSMGAASVLIGFFFIGMSNGEEVNADTLAKPDQDNGHPEQTSGQSAETKVPKKVIVNQKKMPSTDGDAVSLDKNEQEAVNSNKTALKQNSAEKAQAETVNKNQASQKTQGEVKQTPNETGVKNTDQIATSKTTASDNKQEVATAKKVQQQAAVRDANKTTAANNAAIQNKTETAALTDKNAPKIATANNDQTVKESDKKTPNITVDPEVAVFQKEYQDLQTNFDKLSADERTQRAAKIQADYEKMSTQAKTQFALANGVNQQLYSVNNGVADVSTFADFTKALCDKNVTTINMTGDITAADNQSALVSGGTGFTGSNFLKPYELSADQATIPLFGSSPYSGIARTVTIEGNNHTLDMNKWTISFSRQNYEDNPWNFTFKDMTFKTDTHTPNYGPLYFYHTDDLPSSRKSIYSKDLAKTNVTFDNVRIEAGQALMGSQVNVTFSGKNTINAGVNGAVVDANTINIKDGANLTLNPSKSNYVSQVGLKASDVLTIGDNAKVSIFAHGSDINANAVQTGTNDVINLTNTNNTDMGPTGNNAVTFTSQFNLGEGSTLNINTGDAEVPNRTEDKVKDVRGLYSDAQIESKVTFGKNSHVNMNLGSGHSIAVMASDLDIQQGSKVNIHTKQDNNNEMHYKLGTIKNAFWTYPDYNHYAPITLGYYSQGTLHIAKDASLKMVRDKCSTIVPMISWGNATSGGDIFFLGSRNYTMKVDGGATLDIQDGASSKGVIGYEWDETNNLGPEDDIFVPGMITMFGTNSTDKVTFGDDNGNTLTPVKYVNLQRTGLQRGSLVKLEGKAIEGGILTSPNIHNIIQVYGNSPLAQWNDANITDTPSYSWVTNEIETQNGGGDTATNFLPINGDGVTSTGFVKDAAKLGLDFGKSSGFVQMLTSKEGKPFSYDNGEIDADSTQKTRLNSFLSNFSWWLPRRLAFGTQLYSTDGKINIDDATKYESVVKGITRTEDDILQNDAFTNHQIVTGLTDPQYNVISDKATLNDLITDQHWGVDWTKTQFTNLLDSNNLPDANKIAALQRSTNKTAAQQFQDNTEYNAYEQFLQNIYYPDGKTRTTYDANAFKNPIVKTAGDQAVTATVVYKDGTGDIVAVPLTVNKKTDSDIYVPNYGTTEVKQGDSATVKVPTFTQKKVNTDGSVSYEAVTTPPTVTYSAGSGIQKFATVNSDGTITLAPTTSDAVGVYSIPVTVTYADKSTDNISALVDVTDGKSTVIWGKTNPDGSVKGAVVVKPGTDTIHKTSETSSSINSLDPKKAVSEIDVYTTDAKDSTKLDQTTYTYNNGAYVDDEKNSIGDVSVSYGKNAGLDTTTGDSTTLPITVTFGTKSLPAQKGIINNGAHTNLSENINFAGASAILGSQISLPMGYDVTKDPEGYFTSDHLATLINHSALDKIDPAFKITGYSLVGVPDTSSVKAEDMTVRISFADKMGGNPTYLDVQIPNGINATMGDAGQYNPTYADTVDSKQQAVTVTPSFGNNKPTGATYALGQTSEQNLPATMKQYVHVDNNTGAITIDQAAMNDTASYEIPVVVTYKDGTHDNAVAKVYEVKGKDVTDPTFANDAISNFENLPSGATAKWETAPDPHKYSQKATVDVTLPDNQTTTVTVNVTNTNALKPNTTIVYGQDTTTTITVETPSYHKTSADNNPTAPRVSKVTIVSDKDVTTTYNLSSDGKTYTSTDGKKSFSADQIKTAWEDGYKLNTNTSNFSTDGSQTTLVPVTTDKTSDEWDGTHNSKYRVDITLSGDAMTISGIPDGDAGWSNAYANIYGAKAASASDANKQLKAVQNVDSSLADPSAYVDTSDLTTEHNSKVESVSWNTKPDLTKAGTITPNVDINFVDGTKLTIPVKITVAQSDANKFETDNTDKNPLTQTISVHTGATVAASDAIKGFSDATKTKYGIVSDGTQFNETVPTTDIGTIPYAATVKFADGSSTTVNIPVKVYTDKSNFDDANKNNALTHEITEKMGSVVADTDAKNGVREDPNNIYHIVWTDKDNLKAPRFNAASTIDTSTLTSDTNPDKSYAATIYFEDGTSTTVNIPVKIIGSDASKFAQDNKDNALVQTISKGKGYKFKDTDASQGIKKDPTDTYHIVWTDKDSLKAPRFNDVSKIDSSKETSMPTDYDATVYFEDGTKLGVKIPVIITDQATDHQNDLKTKTYQVDQNGTVSAGDVIDTTSSKNIPEGTTYAWSNKTPDTSKVGTQEVTIIVTYPDGTKGTANGKVTVEATPETTTVTLHQGVTPTKDDATSSITNLVPAGQDGMPQSVVWKAAPSTATTGESIATVNVTYNDGYTKEVTVPINVWKTTKGSDVTKPSADTHDIYREITRTITVDNGTPQTQKVVFTRDKYTDTTDAAAQPTYSDWVAKDGKDTFAESAKLTKDGYTATVKGTDITGKPIALTANGTIAGETVTADSQSENITVTNTANDQKVTIKFINAKDDSPVSVATSKTFTGKTDGSITISPTDITIPASYKLDKDSGLPITYTFTADKDQTITVKLDHLTTLDPTNPDVAKDPKNSDMFESITRKINSTDPTKADAQQQTITQTVKFQRTKTVNDSDSTDITYGDWTPADSNKSSWDEYTVPTFTDYTVSAKDDAGKSIDITSGQIASQTVTAQTANTHITLTYSETDAGKFKDKNKDNSQVQTILVTQNSDPTKINASGGIRNLPKGASVAFDNGVVIDTKTLGTTSYPATITFADNTTAKVEIPVKVYNDATVFNEDNAKTPLAQTITEKQGTDVDPTDAIKGFSADVITKYNIDTSNFNEKIDTSTVTTTPVSYAASVYFKDGSHTTVKIPVQIIASEASQFNDAVKKDATIVQGITVNKYDIVAKSDALKGIKNPATYNVIAANFDEDVDTSVVGKKTYPVIVTFNDGSTTTVQMSVTVEDSQASKFKDNYKTETQVVEELLNSQVPVTDAMKGIKNAAEIGATNAKFNYDVDTTALGSKDYDATVSFSDGSSTVVPITVKVVSLADKFDDTVDLTAVTRKIGQTVKNTDAIEGVVDATKHGVQSAVFTEDVPTNEQGSTPYDATLTFTDGSKKDVKITVNVGANEASTFNKAQLVPLVKIPVGTKIDPADTTNAQAALKDPSQIGKTITSIQYVTIPDTSKPRNIFETPVKITFNDGSTKTFEQAIQITSEADNYTGTPQNIDILHNTTIDPENTNNAKGAATDPDNTIDHIQFVDPKDIDPSTLGKQIAPATITFKDGSTKTISIPVTIVPNEADKFSPNDLNKPITVKKNTPISKGAEVADAIDPIKKAQDNVTSITYETVPDTTVPGTTYPAVKVTFNDGSSITTNLPVVVSTTKTGNPYQAGTQGVNDASNYYIYREIMIHRPDSDQEDIVTQVIHFIRKDKNGNSSYTTDGKTTYVPWTVADSDGHSTGTATGHFKEYETPRVADYAANKSLIADEEVAGDPYGATPVSRDRVEKVDINYNFDMNQVSMAYLAVPASFTPGDNLFLQLAAYDNKTGKQIKLPKSVKFEAKSLPAGVKLDEQTGSLTVPKGMQVGKNQVQVMALAQTGQKEVDAQLNVVNKPDSGQTTPTTPVNPTPITPSTPTTPTKQSDADKFAPQTQDITTTVDDLPDASSAISNLDNLPSGTKASWQTAPEVSESGLKTANIVVTYPDGSQDTTSTMVIVEEKTPEKKSLIPVGQKIKTKKNVLPKPIKGIKNRKLMPVGTKYAWKKKPNVSKIGTIKAIVKVTYPNGKKFNIKVKIIVSDVIKTHASTTVDHLPSASSMLENASAGTKAHWIKKPDVSKPGQAKGIIGIDYPNGQKEKKDVFISVKPGNSLSMNSTKHVERSSSHSPKSESYAYNSHLGASTNGASGRQASVKAESINGFTSSSSPSPLAEIGRQGQIRTNKNLRSELGKNNSENVKNNTNSKELPETGEKDSELEALGMMAASLSLIGLAGVKKRKH